MNKLPLLLPVLMTGSLLCNTAFAANQRPVADKQSVTVNEDSAANPITLVATDADGDTLTYEIVQKPRKGTLTQASPGAASVTYTPDADYNGADRFLFRVSDGKATSTLATVTITVQDVADAPPTATNIITNTKENAPVTFTLLGAGGNGATLNYAASTPANGNVSIRRDQATYTPKANFNGNDSFTYTATDGAATSTPATVNISVATINNAPKAENQTVNIYQDTLKSITLIGSDVEDADPVFEVIREPLHGILNSLIGKDLTYTPKSDYIGQDSFTYRVTDYEGARSEVATVYLNTIPAPVADLFLQGRFMEVGIHPAGSFGTVTSAPAGYHPSGDSRLSMVVDMQKDGWNVGIPPKSGDYSTPGSPEEGWAIEYKTAGVEHTYSNFGLVGLSNIPATRLKNISSGDFKSAVWEGELRNHDENLKVTQTVTFHNDSQHMLINVTLKNTGITPLESLEYMRNIDPDQEASLGGDFTTINHVAFQPNGTSNKALVIAKGTNYGIMLGLGAKDSRAVVSTEGFSNRDPDEILDTPIAPSVSSPSVADKAIALAFRLGTLNPGESVSFDYTYILSESELGVALGGF